jgi:hypothetical protein
MNIDDGYLGGLRVETADRNPGSRFVYTENGKRIVMISVYDPFYFRLGSVTCPISFSAFGGFFDH